LAVKANNVDEIDTKEVMSPAHSLSRKGHVSGGGKNGEAMKNIIADASLTVCNAYVKDESDIEKLDPSVALEQSMERGTVLGRDNDLL
jgi:sporulation-control protein spo0M